MLEPQAPWILADEVCDKALSDLKGATAEVMSALVDAKMPVGHAAALMGCLAEIETGINKAKVAIGEWLESGHSKKA